MKIELLPNSEKDIGYVSTREVIKLLLHHRAEVWMPSDCPVFDGVHYGTCELPDMMIVLGGDGSIMRAAHRAARLKIPVLGVNLGRIGYLAEINPNEIALMSRIFERAYVIESRMMIEAAPYRNGIPFGETLIALNDAVLSHGPVSSLLKTEIRCGGRSLGRYYSDGFLVSTPTGSTAYSLAAGGPILDPQLRGLCLVPICPHSLTARPLIVPEESDIELHYLASGEETAHLTVDGIQAATLFPGDSVHVRRSPLTCDLVRIDRGRDKSFYDILREKLSEI
ncbi:MAG: NAD(+)/NADH kinase [Ruminococcaceae bacterium]|nr:NAD(+)/NADH kinase [Oscillospiraceae bacterium]